MLAFIGVSDVAEALAGPAAAHARAVLTDLILFVNPLLQDKNLTSSTTFKVSRVVSVKDRSANGVCVDGSRGCCNDHKDSLTTEAATAAAPPRPASKAVRPTV